MNKNALILFLGGMLLAETIASGYIVQMNWWNITHQQQVNAVRADFEGYTNAWELGKAR
jgi:hypothetical protein